MKDTTLTAARKKTELITLFICFVLANFINLYSIIRYGTSYLELLTSIGYVAAATLLLYIVWSLVRLIVFGVVSLIRRNR